MTRNILILNIVLALSYAVMAETTQDPNTADGQGNEPSLRIKPTRSYQPRPTARAGKPRPTLIRDGYIVQGIAGKITREDGVYYFAPKEAINDSLVTLPAGTKIELVRSSSLASIERFYESEYASVNKARTNSDTGEAGSSKNGPSKPVPAASVRFWARVIKYRSKNYFYPMHFIPMSAPQSPEMVSATSENSVNADTDKADKESDSILPPKVLEKLKPQEVVNLAKMREYLEKENDVLLVSRTGFLTEEGDESYFELDGFGLKLEKIRLKLLPSQCLETTQLTAGSSFFRRRFEITGIVTRYNGQDYLLLQRAVRTYANGNFNQ